MASPTAEGLFHKAIGESGAVMGRGMPNRIESEAMGVEFAKATYGDTSLAALRAVPALELLEASQKSGRFSPNIDGWFLPETPTSIYAAGRQSEVPLLAGWNLDEGGPGAIFGRNVPTLANYIAGVQAKFGEAAAAFLAAYPAANDAEALRAASDFGGDSFIGRSTWKWIEAHARSGEAPVYRYLFDHPLPLPADAKPDQRPRAAHSWEIEYVFGVIDSKALPWRPEDYKVSELMMNYWTNFAKRSDPNGADLPEWPAYQSVGYPVMHLNPNPTVTSDDHRARYEFLDRHEVE
jgi:para-nitrobenzyl esterase